MERTFAHGGHGEATLAPVQPTTLRTRAEPLRHRWIDVWRGAKSPALKSLVKEVDSDIAECERTLGWRHRSRRPIDEVNHRLAVEVLVCNLVHAVLQPSPTGRLAVRLGHGNRGRTRYDNGALGKTLSSTVSLIEELGHLDIHWPKAIRGEVTSIAPTASFVDRVRALGITLKDFGRCPGEEVLILTCNTKVGRGDDRETNRELVNYPDTEVTTRLREPVRVINEHLSRAALEVVGALAQAVDIGDVVLRRRFLISPQQGVRFDQGGRLFGGFWQTMPRQDRRSIRIDGQDVVELDYSSMFSRLAYAEQGLDPPRGDLYRIPGLEEYRSGVKLAMNCFLFDNTPRRRRWPDEMGVGVGRDDDARAHPSDAVAAYSGRLPEGWTVARTKKAILKVHPRLNDVWGEALGYRLMFIESEIMVAVLLWSMKMGITVLPLHDGLIVPMSQKDEVRSIMERSAKRVAGIEIPVTEKT